MQQRAALRTVGPTVALGEIPLPTHGNPDGACRGGFYW